MIIFLHVFRNIFVILFLISNNAPHPRYFMTIQEVIIYRLQKALDKRTFDHTIADKSHYGN